MGWLKNLYTRHVLKHHPIPYSIWNDLVHRSAIFHRLSAVEKAHLREMASLFLRRKSLLGVQGLAVTNEVAVAIAVQACLPVLKLGLDYLDGWIEVTLYPEAFVVEHDERNSAGIVSHEEKRLSGESWSRGPVILSWQDVQEDLESSLSGRNVVIHEIAHKLDLLNGSANGMPPLHSDMVREQWTKVFSKAFDQLCHQLEHDHFPSINPYAATSPAEFFAVASELFFTAAQNLQHHYPQVYEQLALFYRQDPLSR